MLSANFSSASFSAGATTTAASAINTSSGINTSSTIFQIKRKATSDNRNNNSFTIKRTKSINNTPPPYNTTTTTTRTTTINASHNQHTENKAINGQKVVPPKLIIGNYSAVENASPQCQASKMQRICLSIQQAMSSKTCVTPTASHFVCTKSQFEQQLIAVSPKQHWSFHCNVHARALAIDCIQKLHSAYEFFPATLYYALSYLDMFLHMSFKRTGKNNPFYCNNLKHHFASTPFSPGNATNSNSANTTNAMIASDVYVLLAVACLTLATKFNEVSKVSTKSICDVYRKLREKRQKSCCNADTCAADVSIITMTIPEITLPQLIAMEQAVWRELEYDVSSAPAAWEWLCHIELEKQHSPLLQRSDAILRRFMKNGYWIQCEPQSRAASAFCCAWIQLAQSKVDFSLSRSFETLLAQPSWVKLANHNVAHFERAVYAIMHEISG
jgi:hypothetical protein